MRNLSMCVLAAAMAAVGTTSAATRFDASGVRDEERYAGVIVRYVDAVPTAAIAAASTHKDNPRIFALLEVIALTTRN